MRGRVLVVLVLCLAVFAMTGCWEQYKEERGRGDAPVGEVDDTDALVINFPNDYPGIATKCGAPGQRIYTHTRSDPTQGVSIVVVEDENC